MNIRQIQKARESYGIDSWGAGYFGINDQGNVCCYPTLDKNHEVDLNAAIEKMVKEKNVSAPMILRFPQIVESQLNRIHTAFAEAIWNYDYAGKHYGVFPFKVNQRREFIDSICKAGQKIGYGLEVGSKTEFMAALSYDLPQDALFICNGFKDVEFIRLAFIAKSMQKNITVVVEGPDELEMLFDICKESPAMAKLCPEIGLRIRLYSRSSGKWAKSSGETSKFGLSTNEVLHCLAMIKAQGLSNKLSMLHFHNGSQITQIKRLKNAVKEASRVYAKIVKMGFEPRLLNVGGGIGVDYDGSKTSCQSSANYTPKEFASDCVYTISQVCKDEKVACPDIVTESGRIIAAHHSVVITNIREVESLTDESRMQPNEFTDMNLQHKSLQELDFISKDISQKNYNEYYHDAIAYQEELFTLFNLGYIDLAQRACGEKIFFQICQKAIDFSAGEKHQPEEFAMLQKSMVTRYLANFSIFQSIPDAWSIDQLFPIMPLARHSEVPDHKGTIVDITCDSDGCIERFVDRNTTRTSLDLHTPDDRPYYIGFFLVGAYQESLANEHNLFGAIHEAEIFMNATGQWHIGKVTSGDPIDELLVSRNFELEEMLSAYKLQMQKSPALKADAALEAAFTKDLQNTMRGYPYLLS